MAKPIVPTPTPKDVISSIGKVKTTTPTGVGIGATKAPTVSSIGGKAKVGAIVPKTTQPAKKVDNSPLGAALSFGQSLIDVISTPMYYVEGGISGAQDLIGKISQGKQLTSEDYAGPTTKAVGNAGAWTRGEQTVTGSDILKAANLPSNFWTGLAADILLDPLTYTPGVVVTAPLKAMGIATKTGIKATKAASQGAISAKIVTKAAVAETKTVKAAEKAALKVEEKARTLKPGAALLNQYSRKPLIKQNLMTRGGEALTARQAKVTARIGEKFTYKVVDPVVTASGKRAAVSASDIIASGIEAAWKAGNATLSAEIAKDTLARIAKKDVKIAKAAQVGLKGVREEAAVAEKLLSDAAIITTKNNEKKALETFAPHVIAKGEVIVLDNSKIVHTFNSEKQAQNWIAKTTGSKPKSTTRGPRPVMDVTPVTAADRILGTLPVTEADAKTSLKALKAVDKIVSKATGITTVSKPSGAVGAILSKLPKGTERTYAGIEDFIAGIRNKDQVDFSILEKIVKTLDPENKLITQIQKGLDKPTAYEQLKTILVDKGVQTVFETERRISLIDPEILYKTSGLAYADSTAFYASGRIAGDVDVTPDVFFASREKAIANIQKWSENETDLRTLQRVLYSINNGLGKNFDYIQGIIGSPDVVRGISSFGDLAVRNTTKAYEASSKAALLRQINQSGEAKILGSLFGIARKDLARKFKRTPTPAELEAEFIKRSAMMQDALLAVLGARVAYQKGVKGSGGIKHFVYLSISDVAQVMAKGKKDDLLQRALFPDTRKAGILKTDALSTIGVGQAIRKVLESKEAGNVIDMAEIETLLRSRGDMQTPWSATFTAGVDDLVSELAKYITEPKVISAFEATHLSRAKAGVDDVLTSAETITEDLFNAFIGGHLANIDKTIDSVAARADLVRKFFNEFAYASGIFRNQSGKQAEALLQAAVFMFISGGKMAKLTAEKMDVVPLIGSPEAKNAEVRKIYGDAQEALNGFFKQQDSSTYASAGRERLPLPSEAAVAKATDKLTEAQTLLDQHIIAGESLASKTAVTNWNRKLNKVIANLDEARLVAWQHSVETFHRLPDGAWIKSTAYDVDQAEAMAKEFDSGIILTPEGAVAKSPAVDKKPYFPSHKALTAEESKQFMIKWRRENKVRSFTAAESASQEAARKTLDQLKEIEALGLGPAETAQRIFQDQTAKVFDGAVIKVFSGKTSYAKLTGSMAKQVSAGGKNKISERLSATAGRWNLKPLLNRAESTLMQSVSSIYDYSHHLRDSYLNVWKPAERSDKFIMAFRHAVAGTTPRTGTDPNVIALANDLRNLLDPIFGTSSGSGLAGIDREALIAAFAKKGLNESIGFINPRDLSQKQFNDYTSWLPFAKMPAEINKGSDEAIAFAKRAQTFREEGLDPFIVVTRMAEAIQFAKTEKAFAMDFAVNFSYLAHNKTFEQAVKEGWVKIEGVGAGGTDLTVHLPAPEKGGLFPPDIAAEFMSLNREWNKIYNDKGMPTFVKTSMEIVGLFKATQTILRLGHHVTNMVGDITTAIIAGTRNPIHWKQGIEIAMQFASEDLKATWGKNKMSEKLMQAMRAYGGYGRAFEGTDKTGRLVPAMTIYGKDGVAKRVNLSNEDLLRAFQERGIVVGNIFQNDIQGTYDSIIANPGAIGEKKKLQEVIMAKVNLAAGKVTEPAGSFAAHYGNIPRAAHAMRVIQSRSWSSIDEALNAASVEVTRYHPTIQSLAATERRYPRLAFTYYTWLRVAHNALIDMAVNHTASMTVPFKIQYQQAEQAGFEPQSVGVPWGNKATTPEYLNYSVYGPTEMGSRGPIVYKRSILPMDVLDTWNFTYDPAYTTDVNAFNALKNAGRVVGKNVNLLVQPVIEGLTGTDMATGRPSQVKDIQSLGEKILNNIGTAGLFKGTGLYTPSNKGPTSTDPYDAESRKMLLENWLFGQKAQITDTNANIKNAQTEQAARNKAFAEKLAKEQGTK